MTVLPAVLPAILGGPPAVTADQVKGWREKYNGKPMQKRADLEAKLK